MAEQYQFDLDAGVDCLAFANTLEDWTDAVPTERIATFQDMIAFSEQTGQLPIGLANDLRLLVERHPEDAERALEHARTLRKTIFQVFSAIAAGKTPDPNDLDILNADLHEAMARTQLVPENDGFTWTWPDDVVVLERAIWPVVRSAADLLISGELDRVRECAASDCSWLFFDESRNRSRRWCSMQTCGNRAKVDRFRTRRRQTETAETAAG